MKRRRFVQMAPGLVIGPALTTSAATPQSGVRTPQRTSALSRPASVPSNAMIQSIVLSNNTLLALYLQFGSKGPYITATGINGESLWQHKLPRGMYSSIGTTNSGNTPLIHAFSYTDASGVATRDCILSLDPKTGDVTVIGLTDSGSSGAMLHYAGDSRFARTG